MLVRVAVFMRPIVHIEFHTADAHPFSAPGMQVPAFEVELAQFLFQRTRIHTNIN